MPPGSAPAPGNTPAPEKSHAPASVELLVRDLGRVAYAEAFALQKQLQREVIESRSRDAGGRSSEGQRSGGQPMHLLLVEHDPPVITISRRKTARQHLVATPEMLEAAGVEVAETDRGGDITYHGPGQLVVYPILDLNPLGLRLHGYMRFLEQIVIDTLDRWGIEGHRDPSATGVWVGRGRHEGTEARRHEGTDTHPSPSTPHPSAKICAMGVRVSRWVSMHGLALNVTTNLEHFDLIVPCGLAGRTVTSLEQELGEACPAMEEVKAVVVGLFRERVVVKGTEGLRN